MTSKARYIRRAVDIAKKTPPKTEGLSQSELQRRINNISESLKAPGLLFDERLVLNEDRKTYREALAAQIGRQP